MWINFDKRHRAIVLEKRSGYAPYQIGIANNNQAILAMIKSQVFCAKWRHCAHWVMKLLPFVANSNLRFLLSCSHTDIVHTHIHTHTWWFCIIYFNAVCFLSLYHVSCACVCACVCRLPPWNSLYITFCWFFVLNNAATAFATYLKGAFMPDKLEQVKK